MRSGYNVENLLFTFPIVFSAGLKVRQSLLTSINWDNITTPGCYTINKENFSEDSSNYPKNIYPWGILYITQASNGGIQQIYIPHHRYDISEYYTMAHRMKFVSGMHFEEWNYAISQDYFNMSLTSPGYIIFLNGLIFQWGTIGVTTGTSSYIVLPIKYPDRYSILVTKHGLDNAVCQISADSGGSLAGFSFMFSSLPSGGYFYGSWFTLGF